jgi:hypothetical protein
MCIEGSTHLTRRKDAADFPDNGFIATQVGGAFENKTQVISEIVPLIPAPQLYGETNNAMSFG